jgi:glyoxylase-like metal-dependent hydrolase (beta-lactamase superfamily II)
VTATALEFLSQEPPPPGEAVGLAGDLRWLRLPVPGPLQHINVWLVPGSRGRVLIDTGMNEPGTHAAWQRLTDSEDLQRQLAAILVTHHHPDHIGMAAAHATRFAVPVLMSSASHAAAQRSLVPGDTRAALAAYRAAWGVDFAALVERANAAGAYERLVSGLPLPARFLGEAETPRELRDPWRISLHFGHAEGHACLHWPEGNLFISGDQLLPSISSNISLYPGAAASDPLGDYLASLERLGKLADDTLVLPAHGQPFRGAALRAAQLRQGHAQRLERLSDFLTEPRTTEAAVGHLFGARNLQGWNSVLAYGETLAHISHLLLRGGLHRLAQADGDIHWVRS